jgi:hypothetical protein
LSEKDHVSDERSSQTAEKQAKETGNRRGVERFTRSGAFHAGPPSRALRRSSDIAAMEHCHCGEAREAGPKKARAIVDKSLSSVTFDPDTKVSRFDPYAFCKSGLTSIHIPSSVEVISKYCFSKCKSLASVTFDSDTKVSQFDGHAFRRSGLTSIHIPSSVQVICEYCFSGFKSLASVTFDSDTKVSRFDGCAFRRSGLTSIHIPSSVEVICERCFYECKSLASVTHDPGSKLRPTLSGSLAGRGFR